jgi:hypothetical protein
VSYSDNIIEETLKHSNTPDVKTTKAQIGEFRISEYEFAFGNGISTKTISIIFSTTLVDILICCE